MVKKTYLHYLHAITGDMVHQITELHNRQLY